MKKALFSCLLLAFLSAGLIGGSAAVLDGRKNDVTVTETVLAGDRAAAEGLQINGEFMLTGDQGAIRNIWWTISQRCDEEPDYDVDFHYVSDPVSREYGWEYGGLQLQTLGDYMPHSDVDWPQNAVYEDVGQRTAIFETGDPYYTARVDLADYFTYVPIDFVLDIPGGLTDRTSGGSGVALYRKLNEVFRIPVTDDMHILLELQASTQQDEALRSGWPENYEAIAHENSTGWRDQLFDMAGACTADGVYFTFSPRPDGTPALDVSQIALGYGIYYLPTVDGTKHEGFREPDPDGLCCAIPLDPAAYDVIDEIVYQEEIDRLFVLARKGGTYTLLAYQESTHELLSMLTLDQPGNGQFEQMRYEGNILLALFYDGAFQLIAEGEDGYAPVITGDLTILWPGVQLSDENTRIAFDGGRLVVVGGAGWNASEDYNIAVLDRSGLQFLASYCSSLYDAASGSWRYLDSVPLEVFWSPTP